MKINRQNLTEEYTSNSAADWIRDFSKSLEKNADYLDNLKSVMDQRRNFSSIDEKMADIKDRAGFNLIKDVNSGNADATKVANETSPEDCSCKKNNCQKCNPEIFKSLKTIVKYIRDFLKDRPDAGLLGTLTHCRQHPTLGFQLIESQVDNKKLKSLIEKIIGDKTAEEEVRYNPEEFSSEEDSVNDMADYMAHAQPG